MDIVLLLMIPKSLRGGNYGHAGMIVDQAKYLLMTGTPFDNPQNPSVFPTNIAGNAANGLRACEEALHKELIREYKIYCRVEQALKDIILEAVDNDYLLEIKDKILGCLNQTPRQMIMHLRNRGRQLNFMDTKKLLSERDSKWDANKVPQVYFNQVKKAIRQLEPAGIQSNLKERRGMVLFYLNASGKYNVAVREWEAKPAVDKTWANIKIFISTKYAKDNKQNILTAKQFKANLMEEQAEATEELIANLTEAHTKQMEIPIKSTTESMKEMMNLMKVAVKSPANTSNNEKKKNRAERLKKYSDAPVYKHCNRKHPSKPENECWAVESNASSRPTIWKSAKST
jgi:hypothetical protein